MFPGVARTFTTNAQRHEKTHFMGLPIQRSRSFRPLALLISYTSKLFRIAARQVRREIAGHKTIASFENREDLADLKRGLKKKNGIQRITSLHPFACGGCTKQNSSCRRSNQASNHEHVPIFKNAGASKHKVLAPKFSRTRVLRTTKHFAHFRKQL